VDHAKNFYSKLGWRLDADFPFDNGFRVIQFTPPGSPCSVQFGTKITSAAPGSTQGLYLIVSNIAAAREDILGRGVQISEVFHPATPGAQFQPDGAGGRASGPDAGHKSYSSFATFRDPDGNSWLLQEVTMRLPGRGLSLDVPTLAELLRETEEHHGAYEKSHPKHNWWDWYAAYVNARQQGSTPEEAASAAGLYMESLRNAAPR
jgi:catechol 2,3-dioxygenase-like lactoylglutathione lyase family enzyme